MEHVWRPVKKWIGCRWGGKRPLAGMVSLIATTCFFELAATWPVTRW
jgi:hypothetical protein